MVIYIPKRGDIVWLNFNPQTGKEIQKTRPALIISPHSYNAKTHLALCMPITSQIKGYPFEFVVQTKHVKGAVLCDQTKSLDWKERDARYITKLSSNQLEEIIEKFMVLLN
ncbi:MAG: endoribonuclease MazF [Gammaproteobacteria bacterium]|nr:endoribonuclease MazF [Gammaproteobacteria bacterium]